jgi:CRP-like cAMP-binding protein
MFKFLNYCVEKRKQQTEIIETEKLQLNEGQCFGEWGLIYRKERSASAYCIEDCDLYLLDINYFDLCFSVKFIAWKLKLFN